MVACGFAPALLFYFTRGEAIGGGDVKTLMVLGAWLGPDLGLECQLFGFIVLAMGALIRATYRGEATALLKRAVRISTTLRPPRADAPGDPLRTHERLGPYLGLSTVLCCLNQYLTDHNPLLQLLT